MVDGSDRCYVPRSSDCAPTSEKHDRENDGENEYDSSNTDVHETLRV